jgi:D-serine deaminase-like pyridoxal phosphate-dependent protein
MVTANLRTRDLEATPSLVIDLATVERNVSRLADYARGCGLAVRPHTKTHKSLDMAGRQIRAGAIGLTVAKVAEAEIMASASRDLLLAYPAVDAYRCRHLADLARGGVSVRIAADSVEGIDALAKAARALDVRIGVLVDLDVGFHRTGAGSPAESLRLAQYAARRDSLRLDGLFFYPGHVWSAADRQAEELSRIDALLAESSDLWARSGLDAPIVSGGSTPTAYRSHLVTRQTEIRPGTYIYNDMNTVRAGFCALEDCAATIVCTVVSTSIAGKAVIDAGTKALTSDRNIKAPESGHGYVVEYPGAALVRLSEEHGELDTTGCERSPRIGERVAVIPNHICPCVNLQDAVWLRHADGTLESSRVDARGRLS